MKKLFLFTVALLTSLMVGATTYTLEPGENKIETAIASAQAGDVIELTGDADNVYTEWHSITIDKAITLRAAEGATPVVHMPKIKMHAAFEVEGIEFYGFEDYLFITEVGGDFSISFRNCVLRDNPAYFIYICADQSVNALTIDNCIFKDNTKNEQPVVYGRGTIGNFEMRNSTVINCPGSYPVRIYSSESIIVDHCTFVNVGKQALRLAETTTTATTIAVSNCVIFSETATDGYAYYLYNGTLTNSVYYNSPSPGYRSGLTVNKIINANPQFIDPANGNLNFAFTSPLFLAATDGSNIGDPRWGVAEPETAIAVPSTLLATQAVVCGTKITASEDGIAWNSNSANPDDNTASWVIDVAKAGIYEVVINETTSSGHKYIVSVADAEGWLGTISESADTWKSGDLNLGSLTFEQAGKYLLRLTNGTQNSSSNASKVIVNYAGGAVVDVPASLPIEDAIINGPRVSKAEGGLKWKNSSDDASSFVTWNVNVTKAGDYEVVVNENTESGHNYSVTIENDQETLPDVGEGTDVWKSGDISLGIISIANTGVYTVKLTNTTFNSESFTNSLSLNYAGGAVIEVPSTLPNEEALLTGSKITRTADGIAWGNNIDVTEDYATWNISVAEGGDYLVTMAVRTGETSEHKFFINIYDGESQQVGETITETTKTPITLAAGTYTVHLGNNKQWSSAVMASVAIKSASGTVVEMPGTLQAGDALLGGDDKVKVDGDGYICFSKDENVPNCWATWQTNWVKTGTYDVILDVNATNGHKLVVEVLDGETVIETFEYGYSEKNGKLSIGKFVLSETKSYTIRLTNKQTWSDARIKSIAFIPFITIDNDDTNVDFTEYENQFVSVQFNRTFTGGMYNPICVPFAVNEKKLEAIFGVNKAYYLDVNNT
ncbi:MAG: DUF4957 domain-containing protein, partial [Bacteroidaceae bacterium]|nr:DUF4957 domain-containing protein [Bacteroidaceae bacterium]